MADYSSSNMRKGFSNKKLLKRIHNNRRRYDKIREFLADKDNWHDVYWDIMNERENMEPMKDVPLWDTIRMGPKFWEAVGEIQRRAKQRQGNREVEKARYPWQEMDKIKKMKTLAERRRHRFEKIYDNTEELRYDPHWFFNTHIDEWRRFDKEQIKHNLKLKKMSK